MEILRAITLHRKVAVRSGHGVGKSWLMARIALWFLSCFYPAKVVTSAPTWFQVKDILWSELRAAHGSSAFPIGGKLNLTELKLDDDWFAVGISTREAVGNREFGATKMQGFHSKNLLVLLDEAAGVTTEIWKGADSLTTGGNNRILAVGNPASPSGDFYNCFKSPTWHKIAISCLDHPNVVSGREIIPGAVTKDWVDDKKREWGEDSPLFKAKVLGEFPAEGKNTLFPLTWVELAMRRIVTREGIRRLGCDVARYGEDKTVIAEEIGRMARLLDISGKQPTTVTAGKLIQFHTEHSDECWVDEDGEKSDECKFDGEHYDHIGVDDSGVGGGVTDIVEEEGYEVDAINFGGNAIENDKFENLKAEAFWILREAMNPDGNPEDLIGLEQDEELLSQLVNLRYEITRKGKIKIESKDEMKKRGHKSPDRADALAITHYAGRNSKEPDIRII